MNLVDSQLYRPLKSGAAFEGLIPAYKGLDYKFDKKSDNHTTYDTLRFMAQWARKYANQMSKVAPKLIGNTLEQTVNNIYGFLYNHFQYKLDGAMQNLYSPSAAWHFRKTGFDCKTYSVLASCILQNLNIPHSFRMVQQAGIMPGEWSHVYVIVPHQNSYYVIDATTHTNQEVSFTKKHDYAMQHRGLAAPYTGFAQFNGLGCACQGTPIKNTGLGSPAVMANTVKNFHAFLDVLEANGISREVTNRMLSLVKWNIDNGIDPNMQEIAAKAFASANQGLATGLGTTLTDLSYQAGTAIGNTSIGGVNIGTTANQLISGNFVGAGLNIVNKLIPINDTFGAVFANGFDLSCWGASLTPTEAKKEVQTDFPIAVQKSGLTSAINTQTVNTFIKIMTVYRTAAKQSSEKTNFSSCTRKANEFKYKAADDFIVKTLEDIKQTGVVLTPTTIVNTNFTISGIPGMNKGGSVSRDISYQSYAVSYAASNPATQATTTQTIITNPDGTQSVVTTTNNNNTTTEKKSNLGTLVTIGSAIALGAKLLL